MGFGAAGGSAWLTGLVTTHRQRIACSYAPLRIEVNLANGRRRQRGASVFAATGVALMRPVRPVFDVPAPIVMLPATA